MCALLKYSIFLSDDNDSKKAVEILIKSFPRSSEIRVFTRKETIDLLPDGVIPRRERNKFRHI